MTRLEARTYLRTVLKVATNWLDERAELALIMITRQILGITRMTQEEKKAIIQLARAIAEFQVEQAESIYAQCNTYRDSLTIDQIPDPVSRNWTLNACKAVAAQCATYAQEAAVQRFNQAQRITEALSTLGLDL